MVTEMSFAYCHVLYSNGTAGLMGSELRKPSGTVCVSATYSKSFDYVLCTARADGGCVPAAM